MVTTSRRGTRLMTAGAIVTAIGLALAVGASLDLPSSWNTAIAGLSIFAVGALRRVLASGHEDAGGTCGSNRGTA